ncbi:MAG: D-alanine--D-alanine ligase family protein [Solirubrobacterales bacterium]
MKVAVLQGGPSLERLVSLRSGARVADALARLGHDPVEIDVGPDLVRLLADDRPDAAFVALHGRGGEDGTVQELLEILEIPFTGPGVASCINCMDKVLAKHALRQAGVATPDWVSFSEAAFEGLGAGDALGAIEARLGMPLVVKPARQGSALGVKFASSPAEVPQALVAAFSYDDKVLLEQHVSGRELAVSVVGDEPLPVVEAIPQEEDFYDFASRYDPGRTEFRCPAELGGREAEVRDTAVAAYRALGCAGFARVDIMLPAGEPAQVLEANAIPGLTEMSLLPRAAEAAGLGFDRFVARALELALDPAAR